eukprot:180249_1
MDVSSKDPELPQRRRRRKHNVAKRVEQTLQQSTELIDQGRFYEAEQLFKSLHNRSIRDKCYSEVTPVMQKGAYDLLQHGQGSSGGEISLLFVQCLVTGEQPVTEERIEMVLRIFHKFPEDSDLRRAEFMKAAIRWTSKHGSHPSGDPALHFEMAKFYAEREDHGASHRHYLRAQHPCDHLRMVEVWAKSGFRSERDLFFSRCVLQYLYLQNLTSAQKVFSEFMQSLREPPSPILNFTRFLLSSIDRESAQLFGMLRQKYKLSIDRDPGFARLLDKVGKDYFNLEPVGGSAQDGGIFDILG